MPKPRPIPKGSVFGRLTVLRDRLPGEKKALCRCECGIEKEIAIDRLGGKTRSCGCLRREVAATLKASHGMADTKIYYIWADMVARCTRPTHARYVDYGGRGITVCEQWRKFDGFYADMGDRPDGLSLDRKDNNAGYSPGNCRWATPSEQMKNRRGHGVEYRVRDECGKFLPGSLKA